MGNPLERLARAVFKGAPMVSGFSASNQIAGLRTLASGTATVTVSTTQVKSDSIIQGFVRGGTGAGSVGLTVHVGSINPGNAFTFVTADGQNAPRDLNIMWALWQQSV